MQVWAVDANEEQLKQCKPQPNITFKAGCAEKIDLPSSSLDLVTVATALHWCAHLASCLTHNTLPSMMCFSCIFILCASWSRTAAWQMHSAAFHKSYLNPCAPVLSFWS